MEFANLTYGYHIGLLNKALVNNGGAIWQLYQAYVRLNTLNEHYGFCDYYPYSVIARYVCDNFDPGSDAGNTDCKWHNVEGSTNIIDLLDKIQNGDTAKTKELFKMVDMDIEYNKEPLRVTPYYSFKEEIDQCRNMAERKEAERKAKEEAERKAKEEAERIAKEEAERKAKEEAERKAKEEAERIAKEEAERKAKEETERIAKEEAERKAKEEAERKAKEEAERKAKEEAECNSYKSMIEDFVSDIKECEYKDGIIFGKKKKIHYVANPITKRIWNAVVNKSSEADFDDNEFVPQKELGTFLESLNSYYSGKIVFEYLHKNIHALVHLQVYEKQDKNACFVYIKEEN